jgi:P-type Cu+ transporter
VYCSAGRNTRVYYYNKKKPYNMSILKPHSPPKGILMPTSYQLKLSQVSCSSCVEAIEMALSALTGTQKAEVNFAQRIVSITGSTPPEDAIAAIVAAGYDAKVYEEGNDEAEHTLEAKQFKVLMRKAGVSGIVGVLMLAWECSPFAPTLHTVSGQIIYLVLGVVSLFCMWYAGRHLYHNAFKAFLNHMATMDTLIAIGTGAAWIYSMIIAIEPNGVPAGSQSVYFDAALIIVGLVNLGAALEIRARGKTSEAIKRLIGLQAKTARRVNKTGIEEDVPIEVLQVGDIIRVRPGEKIAVDGIITEGHSTIDESMLTGESMPVTKNKGDAVFGSAMNKSGSFLLAATKIGKDTALSHIINLVQNAQSSKPPIAKLADTASSYFVPTILIVSLVSALVWFNVGASAGFVLVVAITVLVIACPCALGLASPISVIVGMGKSAEYGILIRNGEALQNLSKVTALVLDKTGTITQGQPEVVEVLPTKGFTSQVLLGYAAALEQGSEHPLADAIMDKAKADKLKPSKATGFKAMTGRGVSARVNKKTILFGNAALMTERNIDISALAQRADDLASLAQTPMFLAVENQCAGIISVADPIKPDTASAIARLQKMGIEVTMLTGDNTKTAHAVAKQVGITQVLAEALPQDKADEVIRRQALGQVVGMVGDGINDAPALAQADIGFAIGAGSDVAIESADVTLISNSIHGVINAVLISKATMRNIKQNLFGAFIYNTAGVVIAAGVFYAFIGVLLSPIIASAAMAASSLTVVSNANRLRLFSIKDKSNA